MASQNVPNHLFEQWMRKAVDSTRYPDTPPISRNVMIHIVSDQSIAPGQQSRSRYRWFPFHVSRPIGMVAAVVIATLIVTTIASPSVRTGMQTFFERIIPW